MTKRRNDAGDPAAILAAIIDGLGGLDTWIHEFAEDYKALPRGHAQRVKMDLAILLTMTKTGTVTDFRGSGDPLEDVQEELDDLEQENAK